jgi:hypothetical protein
MQQLCHHAALNRFGRTVARSTDTTKAKFVSLLEDTLSLNHARRCDRNIDLQSIQYDLLLVCPATWSIGAKRLKRVNNTLKCSGGGSNNDGNVANKKSKTSGKALGSGGL